MAKSPDILDRCPAALHADSRPVAGPDEAMPAFPGPHGQRRQRREDGHPRMPVAISIQALELLYSRRFYSVWAYSTDS